MSKEFIGFLLKNDIKNVKACIDKNININDRYEFKSPPGAMYAAIHLAAAKGFLNILEILLEKKADANVLTDYNRNALQEAAVKGQVEACRLLLGKSNCTNRDKKGETAYEIAKSLSNCANPELRTKYQQIVELLKVPTFVEACRDGDLELVKKLVAEDKVDVNARAFGTSGLEAACYSAHYSIFEYLISLQNLNVNSKDRDDVTPLHSLVHPSLKHIKLANPQLDRFTRRQITQVLINAGADVNARTKTYGATPLLHAVLNDADLVVKCLLKNGANVNLKYPADEVAKEWTVDILHFAEQHLNKNPNEQTQAIYDALVKAKQECGFTIAKKLVADSKTFQFSPGPHGNNAIESLQESTNQWRI